MFFFRQGRISIGTRWRPPDDGATPNTVEWFVLVVECTWGLKKLLMRSLDTYRVEPIDEGLEDDFLYNFYKGCTFRVSC